MKLGCAMLLALGLTACGMETTSTTQAQQQTVKNVTVDFGNFKLKEITAEPGVCDNYTFLVIAPGFAAPMATLETIMENSCDKSYVDDHRAYNLVAFNLACGGKLYEGTSVAGDFVQIYDYRLGTNCDIDEVDVKVIETRAGAQTETFVGSTEEK